MSTTTRYFFGKADKLKSRKTIDELFRKGTSFSHFPFKVIWLPGNKKSTLQVALSVGSRNFKKATDRNRIKRLMREAFRLQKQVLTDHLLQQGEQLSVFILYIGKELPTHAQVFDKTGSILKRLVKFTSHPGNAAD